MGEASNNMDWSSALKLASHPLVEWMIPLSLGDSHHGYPVLATDQRYFEHFLYGERQPLRIVQAAVSRASSRPCWAARCENLGYKLGDHLILSHGTGEMKLAEHADKPSLW